MSGLSSWILDELWWTLEFQSRSFRYPSQNGEKIVVKRMRTRRLRFRTVAVTTSNHIDISTYRHIDMACLKDFFPLPRTIIYDAISFQKCSNSGTFTFDVMKCFQICHFQEPSYLMRFLFSNFPLQELSHLTWFLFRNCPFQELSHFMYFFSDLFCFRKNRIWHDFLFLSRGLSSFWAGFLSNDLISKKQGPFQFQTWGGNYVVDIVHVRYIYIYILICRYVFFVHSIFPILHI